MVYSISNNCNNAGSFGVETKKDSTTNNNTNQAILGGSDNTYQVPKTEAVGVKQQLKAYMKAFGITLDEIKECFGYDCSQFVCGNDAFVSEVLSYINKCIIDNKFNKDSWEIVKICKKHGLEFDDVKCLSLKNLKDSIQYIKDSGEKKSKQKIVDYAIALNYDWDNIDDFKNSNEKDRDSVIQRLQKEVGLAKKSNIEDYTEEELKEACKKYFDTVFEKIRQDEYKKGAKSEAFKNKQPEKDIPINTQIDAWVNKLFRQTLGKLLINSANKETKILAPMIASIKAEYQDEAVQMVNAKLNTEDDTAKTQEVNNSIAQNKEVMSNLKQGTVVLVVGNTSGEDAKEISELYNRERNEFYVKNEEIIKRIDEKKKNGIPLTEEEEKIDKERERYNNINAGINEGIRGHKTLTRPQKDYIIAKNNKDTREASLIAYIDQQIATNRFISSLNISDEEKEAIKKYYDKITNGNFTIVNSNPEVKESELKPAIEPQEFLPKESSVGVSQKTEAAVIRAQDNKERIQAEISAQQNKQKEEFTIVKHDESYRDNINIDFSNIDFSNIGILNNLGATLADQGLKNNKLTLQTLVKGYSKLLKPLQDLTIRKLQSKSDEEKISSIDSIDSNSDKLDLASILNIRNEEQLKKLHLDSYSEQRLDNIIKNNVA